MSKLGSAALFQLFRSARPVLAQQAAQRTVGQQLASGLAVRAVVGLIRRIADALDLRAASRTRLAIAAVDGHLIAECRNFLRKLCACLFAKVFSPLRQRLLCGLKEPLDFFGLHALRQQHGRKLRVKKNFIRIGVADSTEEPRIGESTLQSVIR